MSKRLKKTILTLGILVVLAGAGYWYANYLGWFDTYGPTNLPTAEERQRMEEIERSSAQIAPDAKPGASVVPKGTKPASLPTPPATSTEASTTNTTQETPPA